MRRKIIINSLAKHFYHEIFFKLSVMSKYHIYKYQFTSKLVISFENSKLTLNVFASFT